MTDFSLGPDPAKIDLNWRSAFKVGAASTGSSLDLAFREPSADGDLAKYVADAKEILQTIFESSILNGCELSLDFRGWVPFAGTWPQILLFAHRRGDVSDIELKGLTAEGSENLARLHLDRHFRLLPNICTQDRSIDTTNYDQRIRKFWEDKLDSIQIKLVTEPPRLPPGPVRQSLIDFIRFDGTSPPMLDLRACEDAVRRDELTEVITKFHKHGLKLTITANSERIRKFVIPFSNAQWVTLLSDVA